LGKCKRKVNGSAIRNHVHFLGYKRDIDQYMAAFDLLLLTSKYEGAPLVVYEALMSGVPVVSSDVGAVSECVMPSTGAIVDMKASPEVYAEAVIQMLDRSRDDKTLTVQCREYALKRFATDRMKQEYRKELTELACKLDRDARLRDYQLHLMNGPLIG
jgi:L-malate glycosyltransferase